MFPFKINSGILTCLGVKVHLLHEKCVLRHGACGFANDARRHALAHDGFGKRFKCGAKDLVGKGEVLLLARARIFNLGKMAVQIACKTVAKLCSNEVEHAAVAIHVGKKSANITRVEVTEIDHG